MLQRKTHQWWWGQRMKRMRKMTVQRQVSGGDAEKRKMAVMQKVVLMIYMYWNIQRIERDETINVFETVQ